MTATTEATVEGVVRGMGTAADIMAATSLPEPVPTPLGVMEQLEAKKAKRRASKIELRTPIPCWDGELVATFSLLTKAQEKALAEAQANPPAGMKKDEQNLRYVALMVAFHCRSLELNGVQVEGDTTVSGFTAEFGERIGAQAQGGGEPSISDIVWEAVDRLDKPLGALAKVLTNWLVNPSQRDLSGTDPFGPL